MSLISALFNKSIYSYSDAFRAADRTTPAMRTAIQDWFDLYFRREVTREEDPCQQIPYTIVRKLTKTVFCEYNASGQDEGTDRVLRSLDEATRQEAMQMALVGGECFLKPIPLPLEGRWQWTVIPRANLLIFARDAQGLATDIGTAEQTSRDNGYYTLLERRTVDDNGYLTIRNSLYHSLTAGAIGTPVPLNTLARYAALAPVYTYPVPIGSIGLVSLKLPIANCVDGSPDGVSVYAAAAGLIHCINRNEAQLNTEFANGESRVFVSDDLMRRNEDGTRSFSDHIFVGLDEGADRVGVTVFSPTLREESFLRRKQEYLRNVESVIGLKRGLLSEVEAQERTATEVTSSEGDYNLTVIDLQRMWEGAVREAMRLCSVLGQLYHMPCAHDISDDAVTFDWGNGVLYDEDKTWADYLDMVARGLLKPEIALGWRFNMPVETETDLQRIRARFMPQGVGDEDEC